MGLRSTKILGTVAVGEVRRWANTCEDEGGRLYALPLADAYDELRAENERLTLDNQRLTEMWDTDRESLTTENERLRNGLQSALDALDWILAAQQPLRDPWFAHRDALIGRAREALGRHIDG